MHGSFLLDDRWCWLNQQAENFSLSFGSLNFGLEPHRQREPEGGATRLMLVGPTIARHQFVSVVIGAGHGLYRVHDYVRRRSRHKEPDCHPTDEVRAFMIRAQPIATQTPASGVQPLLRGVGAAGGGPSNRT